MARRLPDDPTKTCSVGDCKDTVLARGWCRKHYKRWKSTGDPLATLSKVVICDPGCRCGRHKKSAVGSSVTKAGYVQLSGQYEHPLATKGGTLLEHRKVLYDAIGPGPHPCHWIENNSCGNGEMGWDTIHVDHLDDDKLNNNPENLVPSCRRCNINRGRWQLLDVEDVRAVRDLYRAGKLTQEAIAEMFGVSGATISRVITKRQPWWSSSRQGASHGS